jgi:hypothetical protein
MHVRQGQLPTAQKHRLTRRFGFASIARLLGLLGLALSSAA